MSPGETFSPATHMVTSGTHNEGRGVSPGETGGCAGVTVTGVTTHNEGRGVSPGETRSAEPDPAPSRARTTKAGV